MPETQAQRSAAGRKAAATRRRHAAEMKEHEHEQPSPLDRTTELSEEVLKSLEAGQRAAIEAVRRFVDTVDKTLPPHGEAPSRRQEVIDGAMEMADRLVHVQYDFIRRVIADSGKVLRRSDDDGK
jgi:hypothetical protein